MYYEAKKIFFQNFDTVFCMQKFQFQLKKGDYINLATRKIPT